MNSLKTILEKLQRYSISIRRPGEWLEDADGAWLLRSDVLKAIASTPVQQAGARLSAAQVEEMYRLGEITGAGRERLNALLAAPSIAQPIAEQLTIKAGVSMQTMVGGFNGQTILAVGVPCECHIILCKPGQTVGIRFRCLREVGHEGEHYLKLADKWHVPAEELAAEHREKAPAGAHEHRWVGGGDYGGHVGPDICADCGIEAGDAPTAGKVRVPNDVTIEARWEDSVWKVDIDYANRNSGFACQDTLKDALEQAVEIALENYVFRRDRAGEKLEGLVATARPSGTSAGEERKP